MKKQELKKLLKPLIKECIKEVILEEGILSGIVSEVVQGMSSASLVTESLRPSPDTDAQRTAIRNKMREAIVPHSYEEAKKKFQKPELFEGTEPLSGGGKVSSGPQAQGPLSNIDANDPGVDISGIMGIAGGRWAAHLK